MTLEELNDADEATFVAVLGPVFERSPWIALAAARHRPYRTVEDLLARMASIVRASPADTQLMLINAHPDLAGRVALQGRLTAASQGEQAAAGLSALSAHEIERFFRLNADYRERFGFPFIICARENTKDSILAAMGARLKHDRADEVETALSEIEKIARLRLQAIVEVGE
jgi:2-oxo-4-hydroxy-4-carboxy-5-ureidoimidazoline decarboxylase